jgi:transcriptional regulator with XRE-family HTH domain
MSLARKLKQLRLKAKESLQDVSDAVGISKAHAWELETGRSTNPGLELLRKYADHFKVTVAYLSGEKAPLTDDADALQFFRENEGRLTEKDWETLRTVAESLKRKGR